MMQSQSIAGWIGSAYSGGRALLFVLIDPDSLQGSALTEFTASAERQGADGFLVGGSLSLSPEFAETVGTVKRAASRPVIIFPAGVHHICAVADAILFLSVVSGRNPDLLIGQHVVAAPLIKALRLEAISTAYMIVESDSVTSAEYMSYSKPLPRRKPEIAAAHAMAAEMLGMKLLYLEAGSGARQSVPEDMISLVASSVGVPLMVGGGIRTPEAAAAKVRAGATIVIVEVRSRPIQYLYSAGIEYHFMDTETYEQIELPQKMLEPYLPFMTENMAMELLVRQDNESTIDVAFPASVVLEVTEAFDAARGDSAGSITKPIKVETGFELQVPPFISQGEKIRIDTATGKYIERAN